MTGKLIGTIIAVTVLLGSAEFHNPQMVSAGYNHTALIDAEGNLWTWGFGDKGRLGTGNTRTRRLPIKIMENMVMVACGEAHTIALDREGTLWGWGQSNRGQNGVTLIFGRNRPGIIMDDVVYISSGNNHNAVIKSDKSLWTWGDNQVGQLGDGTRVITAEPQRIMENVVQVAAGRNVTFALTEDGCAWRWGGASGPMKPLRLELENVVFIAPWYAITADRRLWNITRDGHEVILDNVVYVARGYNHSLAIKSDGSLWAWGKNNHGQLGDGTTTNHDVPIKVMDNVDSVSAGENHTIIIKRDGSVHTFGSNTHGQLGNASEDKFEGGLFAIIQAFFAAIWEAVAGSLVIVMMIYGLFNLILPDFMGFASSHAWWHNLLVGIFWIGGFFLFAKFYYNITRNIRLSFQNTVFAKYGINIFPAWHWFLYLVAMGLIPAIRYFELSPKLWIVLIPLIGIPQLDLLIKGKVINYPFLLLRQALIVALYALGFFIFSIVAVIVAILLLFTLAAAAGLQTGVSGGASASRGSNVCPHCAAVMSQKGVYCPCGRSYNAYAYNTPRAADDFPNSSL